VAPSALTSLLPVPRDRFARNGFPTSLALAIHSPLPIHRDHVSGRRAGNDRVAGPGVDREVDVSCEPAADNPTVGQ
jgi:hypothetical protein